MELINKFITYLKAEKQKHLLQKQAKELKTKTVSQIVFMLTKPISPSFCFWYFLDKQINVTGYCYPTIRSISYQIPNIFGPHFEINRFVDKKGIEMTTNRFFELLMTGSQEDLELLKNEIHTNNLNKRTLDIGGFIE